jgi:hypothetical protein
MRPLIIEQPPLRQELDRRGWVFVDDMVRLVGGKLVRMSVSDCSSHSTWRFEVTAHVSGLSVEAAVKLDELFRAAGQKLNCKFERVVVEDALADRCQRDQEALLRVMDDASGLLASLVARSAVPSDEALDKVTRLRALLEHWTRYRIR